MVSAALLVRGEVLQCCDVIGAVVEFMVSAALSVRVKSFSVVTSSGRWRNSWLVLPCWCG
jgi:hypothetical protein